jgi:hypothetical protein
MSMKAKLAIAITLATVAVTASANGALAQYGYYGGGYYGGGYYGGGYYGARFYSRYAAYPGPYGGYLGTPGGYIMSNVEPYSYGGYGSQFFGGPFSGPYRTDSAPLTGGWY